MSDVRLKGDVNPIDGPHRSTSATVTARRMSRRQFAAGMHFPS